MADETKPSPAAEKAAKPDLAGEIGTLTYPRAVKAFGKDRAIEVMQKVAEIGGHGSFSEDELKSPLFGGLGMPSPELVAKPQKEDFAKLPDADFWYDAAVEKSEAVKDKSAKARAEINEYYAGLK